MRTTGFVLGKFYPPHVGHQLLIHFAANYVDQLYVVIGSLSSESIAGELRLQWLQQMFPSVTVLHLAKNLPQYPQEDPNFWTIWRHELTAILPSKVDYLFASEPYGHRLAQELQATFVPVDIARETVAVSATMIRERPLKYWDFIPPCVQAHFSKKIAVFGPESCGKSTLAHHLARHFKGGLVREYARFYLEYWKKDPMLNDFLAIAKGQQALEEAVFQSGKSIVFSDTDVYSTSIWCRWLTGECPPSILTAARKRTYDLYLLLSPDVPWVADSVRYLPKDRWRFFERCKELLDKEQCRYKIIEGDWTARENSAIAAVEEVYKKM